MTASDNLSTDTGHNIRSLTILFLDLDDTLYPKSAGIDVDVRDRISLYMKERLGIDNAEDLSYELYLRYGTTLKGLIEIGYKELAELDTMIKYYHFVHDLEYDGKLIKNDSKLREMLQRIRAKYEQKQQSKEGQHIFRMVIFTNSDERHCTRVLEHLGIRDCFDQFVTFEHIPFTPKPHKEAYEIAMQRATLGLPSDILTDDSVEKHIFFADDKMDNVQTPMDLFGWCPVFVNEDASKKESAAKHGITRTIQTIYELEEVLFGIDHGNGVNANQ